MEYEIEDSIEEIRRRIAYVINSSEISESDKIALYQKCLEIIATKEK